MAHRHININRSICAWIFLWLALPAGAQIFGTPGGGSFVWTNGGGDGAWSDNFNWDQPVFYPDGDASVDLTNANDITGPGSISLNVDATVTNATFNNTVMTGAIDSATLQVNGSTEIEGDTELDAMTLNIYGPANWDAGQINCYLPVTINNTNRFTITCDNNLGAVNLNNAGVIDKTDGVGTTAFGGVITNTGTIEADSGTLYLQNSSDNITNSSGNYVANGGTVELQNMNLIDGTNFSGSGVTQLIDCSLSGNITITNGHLQAYANTVNLAGSITTDASSIFELGGAILEGNATIGGSGTFLWTSGIMGNSETSSAFINTGAMSITGTGASGGGGIAYGSTFTNKGTINWSGGSISVAGIFNNITTFTITGNNMWVAPFGYFPGPLNNSGTIEKTGGSGTSTLDAAVNNSGTIIVSIGILELGSLTNTGLINLNGGVLKLDQGVSGGTVRSQIQSAYDNGAWDGTTGITSSLIAAHPGTAIGYTNTGSTYTLKYTWIGDTNLDGVVNAADLSAISSTGTTWAKGDFNYDGKVNADDYSLFMLGAAYGSKNISTTLPEPGIMLGLIALGAPSLSRRWARAARR